MREIPWNINRPGRPWREGFWTRKHDALEGPERVGYTVSVTEWILPNLL